MSQWRLKIAIGTLKLPALTSCNTLGVPFHWQIAIHSICSCVSSFPNTSRSSPNFKCNIWTPRSRVAPFVVATVAPPGPFPAFQIICGTHVTRRAMSMGKPRRHKVKSCPVSVLIEVNIQPAINPAVASYGELSLRDEGTQPVVLSFVHFSLVQWHPSFLLPSCFALTSLRTIPHPPVLECLTWKKW